MSESENITRMRLDWVRAMEIADQMINDFNTRRHGALVRRIDGTPMSSDLRVYLAKALQRGFDMAIDELPK